VYRTMAGDGVLSGRLTSIANGEATDQASLMMRADTSVGSPFYGVVVTPNGAATLQWRTFNGIQQRTTIAVGTATLPAWYEINRYTDTTQSPAVTYYSLLTSTNGTTWTQVNGSTVALNLGTATLAGMAGSSAAPKSLNNSTWDNVALTNVSTKPPGVCPQGYTCQDIGNGYAPGSQEFTSNTTGTGSGTWTFSAGGPDMWDVYDGFHYVSQTIAGDGTVSAQVTSGGPATAGSDDEWAKAGVMLRQTTDPQSAYYGVFVTPQHGIAVQWRPTQAALTNQILTPGPAPTYPDYVMVGRWTDPHAGGLTYYTAYWSTDNKTFTAIPGSTVALSLPGTLIAGMAADSYDEKTTLPVVFNNFAIFDGTELPPSGACPTAFVGCADIGGAAPAGGQTLTGTSLTMTAGGGDIWAAADQLHFAWQNLPADGSVSAQVASQQNTGPWAKAGVLLRQTTDAGSPYYGVFVTPVNGIVVQYRTAAGAATNGIFVGGVAPVYLRATRFTNSSGTQSYTAYTSPDGVTWTEVPGSTVSFAMTGAVLAGFGADSYSQVVSTQVVFNATSVVSSETPPPDGCTAPWTCTDVDSATPSGTQTISGAAVTVQGGGGDIWDVADEFRFVAQPLATDGTITAEVVSQQATDPWAKGGIMMRATTDPGSPYYAVLLTPANGVVVQWRTAQGATSNQIIQAGVSPLFLQVSRWTNTTTGVTYYSAFTSANGTTWTLIPGSTTAMTMPGTLQAGLAVTSHNTSVLGQVAFGSVAIGTTSTAPPGM